ncbi:DUF924 family protein [Microbulbifer agarilyticus]|uniref:DUF924 family protein n=1 Tax=Microbulbifer agarilyticus TaxID=260552 RepID=UPI001C94C4FB|nr:DUF924 family protein [Microbulbifer agarilyticus]MBY6189537.1 DUF924 domain-containing protein [Microbulbifer agarilyticus]MBY6210809.1 DUF924 domain-containing protein [Microbulbifer agarilyticus]MCA0892028.1 DUF924 domain-containing protein [Microbulbifer agarilyticus]
MHQSDITPSDVLQFWFGSTDLSAATSKEARTRWFQRSDDFDREIARRFSSAINQAIDGKLSSWHTSLAGQLGLILLCDQFPRNIYRGSAQAFSGDSLALSISQSVVAGGQHRQLGLHQRAIVGMPLEHSERPDVQDESVAYFLQLQQDFASDKPGVSQEDTQAADSYYRFARAHQDVIAQFGRYPHRNQALGRESTPDEQRWLEQGGGF